MMTEKLCGICPEDRANKGDQANPKYRIVLFDHSLAESHEGKRNRTHDDGNAVQIVERPQWQSQKDCCYQAYLEDAYDISDHPAGAANRPRGRKKLKRRDSYEEVERHLDFVQEGRGVLHQAEDVRVHPYPGAIQNSEPGEE